MKIAVAIGTTAQRDFIGTDHLKLPDGEGIQTICGHIGVVPIRIE